MVKALLRRGASRLAVDSDGAAPLFSASNCGFLSCAVQLLGGLSDDSRPELELAAVGGEMGGYTPLLAAAARGNLRVCGVLVQAGARLDATTNSGLTPLRIVQIQFPGNAPLHALLSGNWAGPLPGTTCEHCDTVPDSALLHCSGCQAVRYCCPRCAKADWPRHAAYCKVRRAALVDAQSG